MSSKYSEQVIEAACEAIDWDAMLAGGWAIAVAVFDSLERAPWWEEVGVGYEFAPGEPWRTEKQEVVNENRAGTRFTVEEWSRYGWTYFRDTRWTPPLAPLAVGDVITECTPDNLPPEGVGLVNGEGDLCQIRQGRALWAVPAVSYGWEILNDATPFTVVYVPKAGGSDD
jgi:hypothetical protein